MEEFKKKKKKKKNRQSFYGNLSCILTFLEITVIYVECAISNLIYIAHDTYIKKLILCSMLSKSLNSLKLLIHFEYR